MDGSLVSDERSALSKWHPREWEAGAACFGHDDKPKTKKLLAGLGEFVEPFGIESPKSLSELFYPPRVREIYHVYADEAKAHCFGKDGRHPCPVRKQCLLWSILTEEEHGLWGGMSHRERNAMVRKAEREHIDIVDYVEALES